MGSFQQFNESEITEIESLCMNCGENGTTRMLLTKIPFYKDVILMSFECLECGFKNNEIQSAGQISEKGIRLTLHVTKVEDLNRTIVKSDYTCIKIPELDFEIPAGSQKAEVTTVEGVIDRTITALEQDQCQRTEQHPDVADQLRQFISKLNNLKKLKTLFTVIVEDISGNAFLSNPNAPQLDPNLSVVYFTRSKDQDHALGIYTTSERGVEEPGVMQPSDNFTYEDLESEVHQIPSVCPSCCNPCTVNMKLTDIPYFKQVVIMATSCDKCGYRTNEVKSGAGIEEKGIKITVAVNGEEDFSRDILKSDTCNLSIPELDFEVGPATLGGRFSTVEGLLVAIKDHLKEHGLMFTDSADEKTQTQMKQFIQKLENILKGKSSITLILDDPAGNSYVEKISDSDPKLKIEQYERSFQQNEDLGINDMNVDNYS